MTSMKKKIHFDQNLLIVQFLEILRLVKSIITRYVCETICAISAHENERIFCGPTDKQRDRRTAAKQYALPFFKKDIITVT